MAKLSVLAFLTAAPAWANGGTTVDYLALQRCLHCIETECLQDGSPYPNNRESTTGLGASRNVDTFAYPSHKPAIAYPAITTRNELTGQDVFTFDVDTDVMILAASPPPRVKGAAGFWAYAKGIPYFCPTSQIASVWNGHDMGSTFRILLPPMTKERGVRLRRLPGDGSLAEVWAMDNSEIKKWTPTLVCHPDLNPKEKISRNNGYFALADAIRFGVVDQALRTCQRSFLNERSIFLNHLLWGCVKPKIPFLVNLMPKITEAQAYMDETQWSKACCARKFDDIFISRFGRGGLKDDYATPACARFDILPEGGSAAPASAAGKKLPAE